MAKHYWTQIIERLEEADCASIHKLWCSEWARLTDAEGREHMIYPSTRWSDLEATILLVQTINRQVREKRRRIPWVH
jgi:hypothetical protein